MSAHPTFYFQFRQGSLEINIFGKEGPLIIFCHGFPGKYKHLDLAKSIACEGNTVWLIKYRGVDGSSGNFSFTHAIEDVEAVVGRAEQLGYKKVGLFGYSAGAYYSLNAAVKTKNVGAICLLSPVANMVRAARSDFENIVDLMMHADKFIRIESFPELVASYAEVWHKYNVLESVKKLKEIPLIIFEGGDLERGDPEQSKLLLSAANQPKELRMLMTAGHYFDDDQSHLKLKDWTTHFFLGKLSDNKNLWRNGSLIFRFFPYGNLVEISDRTRIAADLDEVADEVWNKDPEYWRKNEHLFNEHHGIVMAYSIETGQPAGFLVYTRSLINGRSVVYIEGINFKPKYQNRGHFLNLCQRALKEEASRIHNHSLYLVARTRHPGILSILQKLCKNVLPSPDAPPALLESAKMLAHSLFPDSGVEFPSMIMRGVYLQFHYKSEPSHKKTKCRFQDAFECLGSNDALFLVGEVTGSVALISVNRNLVIPN